MEIFDKLCEFGEKISGYDIRKTKRRTDLLVCVKSAIANILLQYYHWSTVDVADRMNRMDHSTIVYYRNRHPYRYRDNDYYRDLYNEFTKFVTSEDARDNTDEILKLIEEFSG